MFHAIAFHLHCWGLLMPSNEAYLEIKKISLYSKKRKLIGHFLAKKDVAGASFHLQKPRLKELLDRRYDVIRLSKQLWYFTETCEESLSDEK